MAHMERIGCCHNRSHECRRCLICSVLVQNPLLSRLVSTHISHVSQVFVSVGCKSNDSALGQEDASLLKCKS